MGRVSDILANARSAGLLRSFNKTALAPLVEAVYLPFSNTNVAFGNVAAADIQFKSNSKLDYQNAKIVGLQIIDSTTTQSFPDKQYPSTGLAVSLLNQFLFVARNNAQEEIFSVPLYCLDSRVNRGKIAYVLLDTQVWGNCYIQCLDTTGITSSMGVWVNVYYYKK